MATGKDRRRSERFPTASIPVQLSDVNGELIDLSLTGAAVVHRSPVKAGAAATRSLRWARVAASSAGPEEVPVNAQLLWIIAVVLVIAGIVAIFRGQMLFGILLIVVGLLVGPGGVSVFT